MHSCKMTRKRPVCPLVSLVSVPGFPLVSHIDVWFSTENEANNWGVHPKVPVEVCDD